MTKLEELIKKLGELFELDKADLDFGIHRIIKKKHEYIKRYLSETLPGKVHSELEGLKASSNESKLNELYEKIKEEYGKRAFDDSKRIVDADAIKSDLGQEYTALLKSNSEISLEDIENQVFSHLLAFFSRYYDEGDFLSLRRSSKDAKYSIPYNGEEVVLHWANKDQYYIKSSEDFKDYIFNIETAAGKKRVKFNVVKMDAVQNNNKAVRKFVLADEETGAITETADGLIIPFHFKEFKNDSEGKKQQKDLYEQIVEKLPIAWQSLLTDKDSTYSGSDNRTVLEKHLLNFTKKNTTDYFIHKNLGDFLRGELDFYIKNEVMYLDDIDNRSEAYTNAEIKKIKAIRAVAKDLITFLAQFEDFQKKLWLKKKFVYDTQYCITLDKIIANAPELLEEIAGKKEQHDEWIELFAINELQISTEMPVEYSNPLSVEFLKANPFLVLDTKHFGEDFKYRLLSKIDDIDENLDGLLIHSENFQALQLLQERYKEKVKCIYIDPPYNTAASEIIYKNSYKHSSWNSLMQDRLREADKLLCKVGFSITAIDHAECFNLGKILDNIYGEENRLAIVTVQHNPKGRNQAKFFSENTEYLFFYAKDNNNTSFRSIAIDEDVAESFEHKDDTGRFRYENFIRARTVWSRANRPNNWYPIYVSKDLMHITSEYNVNYYELYPRTKQGDFSWKNIKSSFDALNKDNYFIAKEEDGEIILLHKYREQQVLKNLWIEKKYQSEFNGTNLLKAMINDNVFSYPKSIYAVSDAIKLTSDSHDIIIDYFAGSGTTGHATIQVNREDNGKRKFILVEMGSYFDFVTLPRIKKSVYSEQWENGKPVDRNGISQLIKYFRLESYEDCLNNIELEDRASDVMGLSEDVYNEYLLNYMLDFEARGSLLSLEKFEVPFNFTLKIYDRESGEAVPTKIDLIETFNYLLGVEISEMKVREGFLTIEGKNRAGETILIIWRNTKEKDNNSLDSFVKNTLRINTADNEYRAIYINGDTTLEDPHNKIMLTEEVFNTLMFDTDGI